jgi:hypothetical protein
MVNPFCQYRELFGKVGQGIHSYRVFNIAVADVLITVLAAWAIYYWTEYNFFVILLVLFFTGIAVHRLFCVRTTVDKALFGN